VDDLFFFEVWLYILEGPTCFRALEAHHDFQTIGHYGFNKILELISRDLVAPNIEFFWLSKNLSYLVIFVLSWRIFDIGHMVFLTTSYSKAFMIFCFDGLCHQFTSIVWFWFDTCVYWLLDKHGLLYLCTKAIGREETTKLFLSIIYCYHGFPRDILFDYGSMIVSKF